MPPEPPLGLQSQGREFGNHVPLGLPPRKALHCDDPARSHFPPQGDLHPRWLYPFLLTGLDSWLRVWEPHPSVGELASWRGLLPDPRPNLSSPLPPGPGWSCRGGFQVTGFQSWGSILPPPSSLPGCRAVIYWLPLLDRAHSRRSSNTRKKSHWLLIPESGFASIHQGARAPGRSAPFFLPFFSSQVIPRAGPPG